MDMTDSLAAKSDQINAVDIPQPRTFTIEKVTAGSQDQPFNFHLAELPGKPYRPSKGMRRVMARAWGPGEMESRYPGRRLTLFCEDTVKWAGQPVGGIRISHMSHIAEAFQIPLAESAKVRSLYTVLPLPDAPVDPTPAELAAQVAANIATATTLAGVREWGNRAHSRGLLDTLVDGKTVREYVGEKLAALDQEVAPDGV